MKNKKRLIYILAIVLTIVSGLFVRSKKMWFPDVVNLYAGDVLYAFMMYYVVCFIFIKKNITFRAITGLLICYTIELSQLYQAEWLNIIRQTLLGKLILGSGFLYSDLLAYFIGILAAATVDYLFIYNRISQRVSRLK
ncbi:DUF2809 domain-containing protein [Flavobacterium arcticum]|uniref:DUF2809 domain-containing protein n=1 Tax=Flavobacterium arcticum TaxID=1784713 RepID=A0A345HDV4_9FLAO|nr:DUF2809 domain-containing protein [Flavobacterium arcticum]AXG74764.1 DUF2809 domain-containing protein [Flavobacterium arcticum]KAF2509736.1 DUF2809 domain-containing protein [Flavobacterium arcticum]